MVDTYTEGGEILIYSWFPMFMENSEYVQYNEIVLKITDTEWIGLYTKNVWATRVGIL